MEKLKYHTNLANYFATKPHFFDDDLQKKPNIRKCNELPWQQTHAKLWDEVTDTLCDLNFIQAKACAKLTYDLVKDYHFALDGLPEYQPEKEQERKRQERLDKYTQDLIACAEGKISRFDLEVPESITPWTEDQLDAEIERIKKNPTRADKLKDFIYFLGQESWNLQTYASDFSFFVHQQAWNYTDSGPIGSLLPKFYETKLQKHLLRSFYTRPSWNPLPSIANTYHLSNNKFGNLPIFISQNGKIAFSGTHDYNIVKWDTKSGKIIHILKGHTGILTSISVTPDGKKAITSSSDCTCLIWDLKEGKKLKTLYKKVPYTTSVFITSDGNRAITKAGIKPFSFWDLNTGEVIKTFKKDVHIKAITADGKYVISTFKQNSFELIEIATEKIVNICNMPSPYKIGVMSITPDGKKAITSVQNTPETKQQICIVWNIEAGNILRILNGHNGNINDVIISPDGTKALSCSYFEKKCILWDVDSGEILSTLDMEVDKVSISSDFKYALIGSWTTQSIYLWNIQFNRKPRRIGHEKEVLSMAVDNKKSIALTGSEDGVCTLWNLNTGQSIHYFRSTYQVTALSFLNSTNKVITGGNWSKICTVWDLNRNEKKLLKDCINGQFRSFILVTPDESRLITGNFNKGFKYWDLNGESLIRYCKGHEGGIDTISMTNNGETLITTSSDKTTILWDLKTGLELRNINTATRCYSVAFTADGKTAVLGAWSQVYIWNLNNKDYDILEGHREAVTNVVVSPDGKTAITGGYDGNCILWNLQNKTKIHVLEGHNRGITDISISSDGLSAITSSWDNSLILWNLVNGTILARYINKAIINKVSFFPNGIIGGDSLGNVLFFETNNIRINSGTNIDTIQRIWDFKHNQYMSFSADCPECGIRFNPATKYISTIDRILRSNKISSMDSPCLKLPKEVWEHNDLLSECPNCGEKLKFNPFFVGNYKPNKSWKFWKS